MDQHTSTSSMHVNKYSGETSSYGSRHQRMSGHVPGALAQAAASARTGGAGVQRARSVWQHRGVCQRQVFHMVLLIDIPDPAPEATGATKKQKTIDFPKI